LIGLRIPRFLGLNEERVPQIEGWGFPDDPHVYGHVFKGHKKKKKKKTQMQQTAF